MQFNTKKKIFIYVLISLFVCIGVKSQNVKNFNEKQIDNYRIHSKYELDWYGNRWRPTTDSIIYLCNKQDYKGISNYPVFEKNKHTDIPISITEDTTTWDFNIVFDNFKIDYKKKTILIKGIIEGKWQGFRNLKNHCDIFLGTIKDTIYCYHYDGFYEHNKVYYKGLEQQKPFVIDTFPAYYLKRKDFYFRTKYGKLREFNISTTIDENSVLLFGMRGHFAHIFDVGSMLMKRTIKKETTTFQSDFKNNQSTLNYYTLTEKAEDFISDSLFNYALDTYNKLDKNFKYIYARDIHNAFLCSIKLNNFSNAQYWANKLAKKGVPIYYFESAYFNKFKKQRGFKNFLDNYKKEVFEFEKTRDSVYINLLRDLVNADQNIYSQNAIAQLDKNILKRTTDSITAILLNTYKTKGYPTEEKIGAQIYTNSGNNYTIDYGHDYYVLIRHAYQVKADSINVLKNYLDKFERENQYDAKRSNIDIFKNTQNCLHIYKGILYNEKGCVLNKKNVKKALFRVQNKDGFIINGGQTIIYVPDNYENTKNDDDFYNEFFDYVLKITDDWYFYEKL